MDEVLLEVALSRNVWRSVRYALQYQIDRLERKSHKSHSERSAAYDSNKVANLTAAVSQISTAIDSTEA
jgi:hypothetical protein